MIIRPIMSKLLLRLVNKLRPDLEHSSEHPRLNGTADVFAFLFSLPLLAAGLTWLVWVTDWSALGRHVVFVMIMAVLIVLFDRLRFYLVTELGSNGYTSSQGALDGIVLWAAVLVVGPAAIWLAVSWKTAVFLYRLRTARTPEVIWSLARRTLTAISSLVLGTLLGLQVYTLLGGEIPIRGLAPAQLLVALAGVGGQFIASVLVHSVYITSILWRARPFSGRAVLIYLLALLLPALAQPFGILAAGLYIREGLEALLFLMIGLVMMALLARLLSQAVETSRQQSRQLEKLEQLGRAIINAPLDMSTLPDILSQHVPQMFPATGIAIWTADRGVLLHAPPEWEFPLQPVWEWLQAGNAPGVFLPHQGLPWQAQPEFHPPLLVVPILNVESGLLEGLVYLELQSLVVPWDRVSITRLLPAVQSLSAQVASACQQARTCRRTMAAQKTMQELELARRIQESFLPEHIPQLPGWQLTAVLEPERQMAGDFYDFIELPGGRLGILIADVTDKGLGPALYMALSRTLIRTFAAQYPLEPERVMQAVNQRILQDARANLFVTVFYAVLDPASGLLTYANAGHSPPYLVSANPGIRTLPNTGMPLGIDAAESWQQASVTIKPGDVLVLYTDGVTDAQNAGGTFIDRQFILDVPRQCLGQPVENIRQSILDTVHSFVGDAPRFDDITLVILGRT